MIPHPLRPLLLAASLVACSSTPGLDDEADSSTADSSTTESSTTDSGSDASETGASASDSSDFVPMPDSPGCGGITCDPLCPSCPEGEKCVAYASDGGTWDANKCVPVVGAGAPGDACTWTGPVEAIDDCGPDSWCWNAIEVEGEGIGTCAPVCTGDVEAPICSEGLDCLIANEGSITVCLPTCDPLADECSPGQGCVAEPTLADGFDFHCLATPADAPSEGACEFANACAPGHLCIDGAAVPSCEGPACCAAYCNTSEPSCAPGSECEAMFDVGMAPLGLEDLGVCVLPGSIVELGALVLTP